MKRIKLFLLRRRRRQLLSWLVTTQQEMTQHSFNSILGRSPKMSGYAYLDARRSRTGALIAETDLKIAALEEN